MTPVGAVLGSVAGGAALGVAFNPVASLVGCPLAAAFAGSPRTTRDGLVWSWALVALAWLLGDGFRVMARLQDALAAAVPAGPAAYVTLAVWASAGLAVGYVLPTALGAYVGRRVVKGTGRLSAAFVALSVSAALASLAAPSAALLARLAG